MFLPGPCQLWTLVWLSCVATASPTVRLPRADSQHHNGHLRDVPVKLTVDLQKSNSIITDHFIGHSLGWSLNLLPHVHSRKLQTLARALTPMWVRWGDPGVTYIVGGTHPSGPGYQSHDMTGDQWATYNHFFRTVGWDLIFILSDETVRHKDGSWDPHNARQLLQYSADRNITVAGFELGNEYNLYKGHFKTMVTPQQLAKDVMTLKNLLREFPKFYSSFIMGPDTAGLPAEYFKAFLAAGGSNAVRAATFHAYYIGAGTRSLSNFTDVDRMNALPWLVGQALVQTRSVDLLLPVWLSETGSATNGGVKGASDRFASGFLWLDKLGVCAHQGIQTVIRHVFYSPHEYYGLLDEHLNPNPDYWLTVLYKRIVRGAVFNAGGREDVRVYAACANTDNFKAGSLAVYMLNPNNYPVTFDLPQFTHQPRFRYTLTAGDHDGLASRYIALNGVKLQLVNDHQLPPLKPESAPRGVVTVPAYSYTFLVFPEARVSICLH